jgi:regulator of sirC expression with transglutaminase-like and TPR domain
MITPLDYFASLIQQDDAIPMFEAALSIAQDAEPKLDMTACMLAIDKFALTLKQRMPKDIAKIPKLRMLNTFFYQDLGFAGNVNNYYAPDNSYLNKVLSTRKGIPISLAVIYMELAQQIGLDVKGISFPGHFLMKITVQSGDIIIDPCNGASLSREKLEERLEPYFAEQNELHNLSVASFLTEAHPRTILVRMLRNLKTLFSEPQHWQQFLNVQQRLVMLLPDEITERRDRGLAYANLDAPQAALQDLEAYLEQCPLASDAEMLRSLLPDLRSASRKLH